MLEALRKHSNSWVVKILFVLLILSFGMWGIADVVRSSVTRKPAITVGGTEISPQQVQEEYRQEFERAQRMFGGKLTPEMARQIGLMDQVVDQMVNRTLLLKAAKDLGLTVTDDALRAQIAAVPAFRNEAGQFDVNVYRNVLARARLTEPAFLADQRQAMMRAQVLEAVTGGAKAPEAAAAPLVRHRQEKRVAETLFFADSAVPLPPAPADAVLQDYHQKNSAGFMAPELRAVSAILLRPADLAEGVKIGDDEARQAYDQRIEEFTTAERRNIQQILLTSQEDADRAKGLIAQGKDFAAIAKELGNKDVASLGWMQKGDLLPELADPVFALPANAVSEPLKSPLGWHLFKVAAVQPGKVRPFEEVRAQIVQDLTKEKAADALTDLAAKVDDALGSGARIEEVAGKFGLKILTIPAMDAKGNDASGKPTAAPQVPAFLETAFMTQQGSESGLTELGGGNGYFVLRVDSVTQPALRPFAEVKPQVLAAWQASERQAAARKAADAAAERLKKGDAVAAVAQATKAKAQTTQPFLRVPAPDDKTSLPPTVIAEMFKAQVGGVAVAPTDGGVIVARLKEIQPLDPAANPGLLQQARSELGQAMANDLTYQYLGALTAQEGVRVNRQLLQSQE